MPKIEPYVHRCVVQDGPAAGNKVRKSVTDYDIEYQDDCEFCGNPLAPLPEVIAHIYAQLTGDLS